MYSSSLVMCSVYTVNFKYSPKVVREIMQKPGIKLLHMKVSCPTLRPDETVKYVN